MKYGPQRILHHTLMMIIQIKPLPIIQPAHVTKRKDITAKYKPNHIVLYDWEVVNIAFLKRAPLYVQYIM